MIKKEIIKVKGIDINIKDIDSSKYISLTDIAKSKNIDFPADVVKNWMRNRSTIEFLGLWEQVNENLNFKQVEFDQFKNKSGANSFVLSPLKWITTTNAIGIISNSGRYGGTYAHEDIALEFASWISAEFKLYLIKEFKRLKTKDNNQNNLDWSAKRMLTRINYKIHTNAIKENLIPKELSGKAINNVYASEADVLNMALFGITAKDWRNEHKDKKGNIRDYSNVSQLICLSNLESLNALFIDESLNQSDRLIKLNKVAISQMKLLVEDKNVKKLEDKKNA